MRNAILRSFLLASLAATTAVGCASEGADSDDLNNNPPLASVDELLDGAPKADEIPHIDFKSDEVLPVSYVDLLGSQSPVKSQGSRGVCSIFAAVGYMEHLYLVEGTLGDPDFSEQYLQWSAKFEVGSFPRTSGSNSSYNLQAISQYGLVKEEVWPYEPTEWNSSNDPACTGEDDQPTFCYTNGQATEEMQNAEKFYLPSSRWLHPDDIKRHIYTDGTGVVAGMTFFYQSWNHRASQLPVNADSWNSGFVIYPSAKDKELSLAKRAGHAILLIGWDDEQEMPVLDENGEQAVDADGNPQSEKGCFIFKNSWGTSGFGIESDWGPGYGCISYRYVREYASVRYAGLPDVEPPAEVCGDEVDNDGNNLTDCEDPVCSAEDACQDDGVRSYQGEGGLAIPDNDPVGVGSSIVVEDTGRIAKLTVDVDITHTWRGDLRVTLHRGDEAVVLHERNDGGSADDLVASYDLPELVGTELDGEWRLVVVDGASQDEGTLNGWTLTAILE